MSKPGQDRRVDPDKRLVDILTPDQLRMVKMTFTGASNAQIAYLMGIAVKTVKNQLTLAYRYAGAANRPHMAALLWWEIEGRLSKGKEKVKE